jgi:hypothetical protein
MKELLLLHLYSCAHMGEIMHDTNAHTHPHMQTRLLKDDVMKVLNGVFWSFLVCYSSPSHRIYAARSAGPFEHLTGTNSGSRGMTALFTDPPQGAYMVGLTAEYLLRGRRMC